MDTMILSRRLTLTTSFLGLLTSLSLVAGGCSPSNSSGDGDVGSGGGGNPAGAGGNPSGYSFCEPTSTCPPDVTGADLTTAVSFKTDINPILFEACSGGSGCHQTPDTTGLAFSMGSPKMALDDASQQALVQYLTSSNSKIAPSTPLVTGGNWQNSFLMMKIDGCQNHMGLSCAPAPLVTSIACVDVDENPYPCGDGMPQSEGTTTSPVPYPLAPDKVTKIRAWIQQGALFN